MRHEVPQPQYFQGVVALICSHMCQRRDYTTNTKFVKYLTKYLGICLTRLGNTSPSASIIPQILSSWYIHLLEFYIQVASAGQCFVEYEEAYDEDAACYKSDQIEYCSKDQQHQSHEFQGIS